MSVPTPNRATQGRCGRGHEAVEVASSSAICRRGRSARRERLEGPCGHAWRARRPVSPSRRSRLATVANAGVRADLAQRCVGRGIDEGCAIGRTVWVRGLTARSGAATTQHPDRFDDPVAGLGDTGGSARERTRAASMASTVSDLPPIGAGARLGRLTSITSTPRRGGSGRARPRRSRCPRPRPGREGRGHASSSAAPGAARGPVGERLGVEHPPRWSTSAATWVSLWVSTPPVTGRDEQPSWPWPSFRLCKSQGWHAPAGTATRCSACSARPGRPRPTGGCRARSLADRPAARRQRVGGCRSNGGRSRTLRQRHFYRGLVNPYRPSITVCVVVTASFAAGCVLVVAARPRGPSSCVLASDEP